MVSRPRVAPGWALPWLVCCSGCEARAISALPCSADGACDTAPVCEAGPCNAAPNSGSREAKLVNYTFDTYTEGWQFNAFDAPNNIAVHVPPGGAAPTLELSATEGNPLPGSLIITAPFTAPDQQVNATVFPEAFDLSGHALRARLKLLSGAPPHVHFYVASAPNYVFHGAFYDSSVFDAADWVSVVVDPRDSLDMAFDSQHVVQLGLLVFSRDPSAGPVVLALDSVESVETPPSRVNYTFDFEHEGWYLNAWEDPEQQNLVAFPQENGAATLQVDLEDGSPRGGSLVVTAPFTAPNQFVDVVVDPNARDPEHFLDLSGSNLRARVRLVQGVAPNLIMSASSAPDWAYLAQPVETGRLVPGEWTLIGLPLGNSGESAFDRTQLIQIGIQMTSVDPSGGPVVLEIDSITDG